MGISTEFSGSDAKAVIGGGVKELRNMLRSDKSNADSDEKGSTLEPKDGLNPAKTENDEAKQQTDETAGNKNAKKEEKERAQAEAEQAAADQAATRRANEDAARVAAEEAAAVEAARIVAEEAATVTAAEKATDIDKRKKEQDVKQESQPNKTQTKDTAGDGHSVQSDLFHLFIRKARTLENKDILGKSDPYIHVRFGSKEARSSTVDNTLNPEWQFHTEFVTDDSSPSSVEIKIFDDDFGKSEPLGKLTLDLQGFKKGAQIQHEWLPLDDAATGEVQVSLLSKELSDVQLKRQNHKEENKEKPTKEEATNKKAEEAAAAEQARIAAEEAARIEAEKAAAVQAARIAA